MTLQLKKLLLVSKSEYLYRKLTVELKTKSNRNRRY